jgi:hypothetical protein
MYKSFHIDTKDKKHDIHHIYECTGNFEKKLVKVDQRDLYEFDRKVALTHYYNITTNIEKYYKEKNEIELIKCMYGLPIDEENKVTNKEIILNADNITYAELNELIKLQNTNL